MLFSLINVLRICKKIFQYYRENPSRRLREIDITQMYHSCIINFKILLKSLI